MAGSAEPTRKRISTAHISPLGDLETVFTTEADPLLLFHCGVSGWRSGGGRLRGPKVLRSSLHRERCPPDGSLLRPAGEHPLNNNVSNFPSTFSGDFPSPERNEKER